MTERELMKIERAHERSVTRAILHSAMADPVNSPIPALIAEVRRLRRELKKKGKA